MLFIIIYRHIFLADVITDDYMYDNNQLNDSSAYGSMDEMDDIPQGLYDCVAECIHLKLFVCLQCKKYHLFWFLQEKPHVWLLSHFLCRLFAMKSVQNPKSFWQDCFLSALFSNVHYILYNTFLVVTDGRETK